MSFSSGNFYHPRIRREQNRRVALILLAVMAGLMVVSIVTIVVMH